MIVRSYPFFPALETVLETTAAERAEPSMQQILMTAPSTPMTQEMLALDKYIVVVTDGYRHEYVPVPRAATRSFICFSPSASAKCTASSSRISLRDMMLY